MLTVLVAAAPSLALLAYFYLRDRYDREPVSCLLIAYFLGMYSMLAAQGMGAALAGGVSEEWLHLGGEPAHLFEAFVLSGLVEEIAKWVMLMAAVYHWREFDEPLDGLMYGFSIGADGRPASLRVDAPAFSDTPLPACVTAQVSRWSFPKSQRGGGQVSYPFVFVGG